MTSRRLFIEEKTRFQGWIKLPSKWAILLRYFYYLILQYGWKNSDNCYPNMEDQGNYDNHMLARYNSDQNYLKIYPKVGKINKYINK